LQAKNINMASRNESDDLMTTIPPNDLKKLIARRTPDLVNSLAQDIYLTTLAATFLLDCKAQNLTKKTIDSYRLNLQTFTTWRESQVMKAINQVTPNCYGD